MVRGHVTLLVGHVVSPWAVSLFEEGRDREGDLLLELLLGRNPLACHFVDFEGPDLFSLSPGAKSSLRGSDVNRALKLNFDGLHFLIASGVIRDNSDRAGLTESVSVLAEFSRKCGLLLGAHSQEASL